MNEQILPGCKNSAASLVLWNPTEAVDALG